MCLSSSAFHNTKTTQNPLPVLSHAKMMTSSTENNMESTTLLSKKTNEDSTSFKKYLTPKYAIAATATIALGALGVASQSTSFGRGQSKLGSSNKNTSNDKVVVRQSSRLGAGSPQTISLHTGCSPLNKLPFDTSSDWTGKIGAKVVSKSMQSDFRSENAQNLQETSCGNYEGTVDLEVGEEFGFYLYPLGDESDESTVLDNGCLHEGDARCPAFSSPSALRRYRAVYLDVFRSGERGCVLQPRFRR